MIAFDLLDQSGKPDPDTTKKPTQAALANGLIPANDPITSARSRPRSSHGEMVARIQSISSCVAEVSRGTGPLIGTSVRPMNVSPSGCGSANT